MPRADIDSTVDGLIVGQWLGSPRLQALAQIFRDLAVEEILPALQTLRAMRQIETAKGTHLDDLGRRLGVNRPATRDRAQDPRLGFDAAGEAFDIVPFAGDESNDAVFPMPDSIFRRVLRARSISLLSDGSLAALSASVRALDAGASVQDRRDMSVRIVTEQQPLLEQADAIQALARNAGVELSYAQRDRFGFDEAGDAFEQSPFATD